MIKPKRLLVLLQKLVRIDSQNPPGNEEAIAVFVSNYLKRLKIKSKIYAFKPKRSNVVALLPGKSSAHTLLITPHLDTVPAGKNWSLAPFAGTIRNKRLYGLGATDCKVNLAVALEALNSLVEEKVILDYNLVFAATADEESGSGLGLLPLLNKGILKPSAAVVLDSDDFDIIVAQKGLIHLKVRIKGRRAHGAYPWRGINAIDISLKILEELKARQFVYQKNQYLHPPTINIGTIRGGDKVNIVADWCDFELDFRFLPGMSAQNLIRQLRKLIGKYTAKFKIEIEGIQKPYTITEAHPLVKGLSQAMRRCRISPRIKGSEGATTISFFKEKNIPAVATGFGSGNCAHVADEYVKIDNLYKGARVLEYFLKNYHGRN